MDVGPKIAVLADEDVEEDPDRWCSSTECGQELWQIACQWVWNLRLTLGQAMQGGQGREIEWAPPKQAPPVLLAAENPPQEYGRLPVGCSVRTSHRAFRGRGLHRCRENGRLRCPAGASLWLSEVRQENAFTRAGCLPGLPDRLSALFLAGAVFGIRGQRRSSASGQCCPPSFASPCRGFAKAHHARIDAALVDVAGRALRRTWTVHWRRQYVEVLALAQAQQGAKPPLRPPRAVRSHHRWSWHDRLARNAWWGPPQFRVTVAGVPAFLAVS